MAAWGIGLLVVVVLLLLTIVIVNPDWGWLERSGPSRTPAASSVSHAQDAARLSADPESPVADGTPAVQRPEAGTATPRFAAPEAGDQERLLDLLLRFERSQTGPGTGGDALARAVVLEIARAGNLPNSPAHARTNRDFFAQISASRGAWWDSERPWRWIAEVNEEAERSDNLSLIAHIGLFTSFFTNFLAPNMTVADYHDMRLGAPADSSRARIYSVALRCLPRLDPHAFVVRHSEDNAMQVRDVLASCALDALKVSRELDDGTAVVARRVLGR